MAAQILSFAAARAREPASRDWSRQELAEFYRVESALLQAGLALEGERGLSDEGDPWFVFCRADTGEVFIHFARVDGVYVVDGAAFGAPARGRDFGALVRDLIASHPLATVRRPGSNVMLHPAALLIALVGAAFFHSAKAHAAEPGDGAATPSDAHRSGERRGLVFNAGGPAPAADDGASRAVALDAAEVAAVLTGVAIGLREVDATAAPTSGESSLSPLASPSMTGLREAAARGDFAASGGAAALSTLGALDASDARAALTVMAVFHDLARSVAAASAAPQAAPTLVTDLAASPAAAAVAGPTVASAPEAFAPMLMVHLAGGALPQIEALTLVTADGALSHVAADHVVHVDQLPTFLADLIAHGDVIATSPSTADPSATVSADGSLGGGGGGGVGSGGDGGGDTPTPSTDPVLSSAPAPPAAHGSDILTGLNVLHMGHATTAASATSGGSGSTPTATAPVVALPAPGDTAAPNDGSVTPATPAHDPRIDAAVNAFVTTVTDVQVVISGHDVVFYDPAIMGVLQPGDTLDSVTWRLEDGSSVSLVGTTSELHAFHGLG